MAWNDWNGGGEVWIPHQFLGFVYCCLFLRSERFTLSNPWDSEDS